MAPADPTPPPPAPSPAPPPATLAAASLAPPPSPLPAPVPRVAILGADAAVHAVEARLREEGGRVHPLRASATDELAGVATQAIDFEALILHVSRVEDVSAAIEREAALVRRPIIIVADEPVTDAGIYAALDAGASDCVSLSSGAPGTLSIAVVRAASQARRILAERRRSRELADALARSRAECADVRASAVTDVVTGLHNKRYFTERLDEEENKAYRTGLPLSLVLVDLDHFKSVNDTYGHEAGDRVLRAIAGVIRGAVRNYDVACRYGGEEFAVLLPATRVERAQAVAERIRIETKTHAFDGLPANLRVSATCGVADLPGPRVTTKEDLVRAADRALYRGKNAGRDRVVLADGVLDMLGSPVGGIPTLGGAAGGFTPVVLEKVERLRRSIRALADELTRSYERAVETLVHLVEKGDGPPVFGRSDVVASHARKIAEAMDLAADQVDRIRRAGLLQELGMVPIAATLGHQGALDDGERELVKQHPALSVKIADELGWLRDELPIILHHHENFDGSGYPRGLRGERIPLGSRILAVAMAFEAMTSPRAYRTPLAADEAIREIERLSGAWYDPAVVRGFKAAFGA